MRSLRERLADYKRERGREEISAAGPSAGEPADRSPSTASLERVLPGSEEETPYGTCYYREMRLDVLNVFGPYPLARTRQLPLSALYKVCKTGNGPQDWGQVCFFDTETTGLGSAAGNFIFLFGLGYFAEDEFVVRQYFLRSFAEEPAVLFAVTRLLERFPVLVSFNGKGFDWKLVETRLSLLRMPCPSPYHVDLLPPARRLWQKGLPNCRLSTLEEEVLGLKRQGDLPGRKAPELFFAYQADGDARPLRAVFQHNVQDVLSLVTLSAHIAQLIETPLPAATHPVELFGLARWYGEWSEEEKQAACLQKITTMQDDDSRREALWRLSLLYKRQGAWEEAASLWKELCRERGMGQMAPRVELAKYHEHQRRDYRSALRLTEEIMHMLRERQRLIRSFSAPCELLELEHRRQRLLRKLQRQADVF